MFYGGRRQTPPVLVVTAIMFVVCLVLLFGILEHYGKLPLLRH
jgi:hypothetical protein